MYLEVNCFDDSEDDEYARNRVFVRADPLFWDNEDIQKWLLWAQTVFMLDTLDISIFPKTGYDLCKLNMKEITGLTRSHNTAKILYKHLIHLKKVCGHKVEEMEEMETEDNSKDGYNDSIYDSTYSEMRKINWSPFSNSMSSDVTISNAQNVPSNTNTNPYQMFGPTSSRLASSGSGQIQLWQFLLELLSDSGNANCITWEGTNGEFKLTDPDEVARRWGERKSKPNMNYDKLSRALRYYYDKNIMTKVHGKRYAYKFDFQGLAQATQPTADPVAYKAAYQSADLFMHTPPGYPHPGSAAKHLNFAAAVHSAGISPSTSGSIFPSATSYWTSPGAAANLYSNIAAASATHHAMPNHHHMTSTHVTSHIGSYPHYA